MTPSLLFQPITLGTQAIKNRLVCTVEETRIDTCMAGKPVGERWESIASLANYGVWFLDAGSVHDSSRIGLALHNDAVQPSRRWVAQQAQRLDVKVIQRLTHGGLRFPPQNGASPWGPSSRLGPSGRYSRFMTIDDIREISLAFVSAALMCQLSGLNGIEISVTDMHLMQQFISEEYNERDDRYGGSCKNRCRFLLETVRAVRAAVGSDFAVGLAAGVTEGILFDPDGLESNLLMQLISEHLLDFISVSGPTKAFPAGTFGLPRVMNRTWASFEDAKGLISDAKADFVAVTLAPEHVC
jgi:2,4-dienoyl-CoA reductase-like NADH-dependent reductase (Old Yellow Enzyme family)